MTNNQAIKSIERHMDAHGMGEYPHIFIKEALDMAIDALRSNPTTLDRSRWERCILCPSAKSWFERPKYVRFCEACGRPLTDEAWDELERRIKVGTTDESPRG